MVRRSEDPVELHLRADVQYPHTPHLAQWPLRDRLVGVLHETLATVADAGLPPRVLEIGAGHGTYAGEALAAGCAVTVAEMSRPSLDRLTERYGGNGRLVARHDPAAELSEVGDGYAVALCVSVLHHVPDYLALLDRMIEALLPGGALLTFEDPLWYPGVGAVTRRLDRAAYLTWRVGQGDVRRGAASMRRRFRGLYPMPATGEIGYYHVVRSGVDEVAVQRRLADRFGSVEIVRYWSNHLGAARRPAEMARLANTFGMRATGLRPPSAPRSPDARR